MRPKKIAGGKTEPPPLPPDDMSSGSEGDYDSRPENKARPSKGARPPITAAAALAPKPAPAPAPAPKPAAAPAPASKPAADPIAKPDAAADLDSDSSWSDDSSIQLIRKGKGTRKPLAKRVEAAEPVDLEAEAFVRQTHTTCASGWPLHCV